MLKTESKGENQPKMCTLNWVSEENMRTESVCLFMVARIKTKPETL